MFKLKGLATGIGSLPHKDAQAALDLIFKYTPRIPFWPQLPKRDMREGMIAQFSENLPCLKVSSAGVFFNAQDKDKQLELFYERIIAQDVDYFKIGYDFAVGLYAFYRRLEEETSKEIEFIKCHVTGPFTFAAAVFNEEGMALLHDDILMQAVLKGLAMKARWQINLFKKFGRRLILFFDEPYLGCFGSAYTPINREEVIRGLTELTKDIKSEDVLAGVHCCGNTDWSIFTDVTTIDIISFDAYAFLDRVLLYADNLKKFLQKGGILCWGIVPTSEFREELSAESLAERINMGIDLLVSKGIDKDLLLNNLLISPSCGLGTFDIQKAGGIFKLLSATAQQINYLTI